MTPNEPSNGAQANGRHEVRRVLVVTLVLNIIVSLSKVGIGLVSGSLAIVADGFHSLLDGINNVIALFANWFAGRPADDTHPYGHRRFETLAALGIGVALLLMAFNLVTSALDRLQNPAQSPDYTPLTFAIMVGTLLINLFVAWYERREGMRLKSELLTADASHTASDVMVTISVLISMVLIQLNLGWADPVAALIVVALIARTAIGILRSTANVLADAAPIPPKELQRAVEAVPAVGEVLRVRSRGTADAVLVDVDIKVPAATTAGRTEALTGAIRDSLKGQFDGIEEVEVHFTPEGQQADDPALLARALADPLGLAVHEVVLTLHDGEQALELHVEAPAESTLEQAHELVTTLEAKLRARFPALGSLTTHIEPAAPPTPVEVSNATDAEAIQTAAEQMLRERFPEADWHDLQVTEGNGGLALTAHAGMSPTLPLPDAHEVAEMAEVLLRAEFPAITRVTLHTEPHGNE